MIKIAFADPHISEDSLLELEEIFTEICTAKGDLLIMLGDYYESSKPTAKELEFGTKWAYFFKKIYKKVVFVKGNHDKDREGSVVDYLQYLGIEIVNEYVDDEGIFYSHFMTDKSTYEYGTYYKKISELKKYNFVMLGHQHCVSEDTQILTESGWKYHTELKSTDEIATVNMKKKQIEYQPILDIHKYNYNGKLLEFEKRALVTPNHRMILHKKGANSLNVKLANQINQGNRIVLNIKDWGVRYNKCSNKWAELIGYIIGDGSYENIKTSYFSVRIRTELFICKKVIEKM